LPKVKVKLYTRFRTIAGTGELDVESHNVSNLIDSLTEKFGEKFRKELLDQKGKLRPFHNILINGTKMDRLDTELKNGDIVAFFSPIDGG
jgi:molybdopterin synthase sulfur carrier subunit